VLVMSDQIEIPVNRRHPQKEKPEEMTDSPTNRSNLAPENSSHFTLFQISPPNADKNQSALSRCDFPKPGQASIV